ncbi:xylulokinase [Amphibiibacter pelophylacis]|uniref:Xylulokinase n=1 Tax=Amphibiibacter pelophylacis TaxID=1799477 RepID=A0ACC6P474_9BURK
MFLGIDAGTSSIKVLVLDDAHRVVASADTPLELQRPHPLWSEQHPEDWWTALTLAMQRLRDQGVDTRAIQAVGYSGQMHGAVLLDAAGGVLRPAILWNDGRSGAACEALMRQPSFLAASGNLAMPGFTAPKLMWLREQEPDVFARVATVLLPKDWLRWRMSGERVSDMSDASGTLWLDIARRAWSDDLLQMSGLRREQMPRLVEGNAVAGQLTPKAAQELGLTAGIPLAGGAGDNAASAVGVGASRVGEGFVSLGTSGVIFCISAAHQPNPAQGLHAFAHALPGLWHGMSVMLSAASAIDWAQRTLGFASVAALFAAVEALSPAQQDESPLFLPYLSGERTPHNNPHASAVWMGLRHGQSNAQMAYAVVEGVSFGLMDGASAMGATFDAARELALTGGGSRSAFWATLLASGLDRPLFLPEHGDVGAALGAARLAWMALGATPQEACAAPGAADSARRFAPQAALRERLLPRHQRHQRLYRALREEFVPAAD